MFLNCWCHLGLYMRSQRSRLFFVLCSIQSIGQAFFASTQWSWKFFLKLKQISHFSHIVYVFLYPASSPKHHKMMHYADLSRNVPARCIKTCFSPWNLSFWPWVLYRPFKKSLLEDDRCSYDLIGFHLVLVFFLFSATLVQVWSLNQSFVLNNKG